MSGPQEDQTRITVDGERPPGRTCSQCGLTVPPTIDTCPNDGTKLVIEPSAGKLLFGKYQFLGVVGEGGMSVVYKARHPDLNKIYAVKMLHSHMVGPNAAGRFQQEARAASTINHRNVITIHDYGASPDGQPYIVMDFLEGEDLSDRIRKRGPMPPEQAIELFIQICDGLSCAHKKGIVHRDLKPSNVVLCDETDDGNFVPKLVDFGIAKVVAESTGNTDQASSSGPALTRTGEVLGSPPYMSPEQCKGLQLDARTDIYSLGCLMFEVLTGRTPFTGDNFMEIVFKHMEATAPTLRATRPDREFSPRLEALVAKCLAKRRADRFQTMEEVQAELEQVYVDLRNPGRARGKNTMAIVGATVGGALLIGVLVIGGMSWMKHNQPAPVPVPVAATPVEQASSFDIDLARAAVQSRISGNSLTLDSQSYTDDVMRVVAEHSDIELLDLRHSAVTDKGLEYLSKTRSPIKQLRLEELNFVTSDGMKYLTGFPLEYLNIQQTDVKDAGIIEISKIKTLMDLELARVDFGLEGLKSLTTLPKLSALDLTMVPSVNEEWLKIVGQMKNLTDLELEAATVGDGLAYFGELQKLKDLGLREVKANPGFLAKLPVLKKLRRLDIAHDRLNEADLESLGKQPSLAILEAAKIVVGNHLFGDADVPPLLACKSLKELELQDTAVTVSGVKQLKALPKLEKINITRCRNISSRHLKELRDEMAPIDIEVD